MNKKNIVIFIAIFLVIFAFNYFKPINLDIIWNYGFSLNYSKGLLLYKDFNMVITPLYPILIGGIMHIFGNNMLVFYLINSVFATLIIYIVYKINNKILFPFCLVILLTSEPNYDLISTICLFLLIYLEKNQKNDYLIGFIIGLAFLTKSSVGVFLILPTLYYLKDFNKVLKRALGFFLPNIIIILYFLIIGNLYDYINYAFLGLFNFADGNKTFNLITIISMLIVIFFIYRFRKEKNIEILYIIAFQIVVYPLFNISHFIESLIPVAYYVLTKYDSFAKYYKYSLALLVVPIAFLIYNYFINDCQYTNYPFNSKAIQREYIDDIKELNEYFDNNYDHVHFIMYEAYLYTIMLNKDIEIYNLPLKGNLGYNGEQEFIKKLENLPDGDIIVTSAVFQKGQSSKLIYDYITNNYQQEGQFRKYKVYRVYKK